MRGAGQWMICELDMHYSMSIKTKEMCMRAKSIFLTLLLFVGISTSTLAYTTSTMYTASGHPVTVYHNLSCPTDVYCPQSDSSFEASYGFRSADRWYSGTVSWNCHGRTFDNRQGWVSYAEPWLTYDGPSCPVNPVPGDTVIWWQGSQTAHSVTITGAWNGLSTVVMSKYGSQGQYKHALSNPVAVYGSNWAVTRFTGTTIYSGFTSGGGTSELRPNPATQLFAERETRPWFKSVKASELVYAIEHPRIVARSTSLTEATRQQLLLTEDPEKQAKILVHDLANPSHGIALSAFNGPQFTEEFITGMEAGKLLVLLGNQSPEVKPMILDLLAALANSTDTPDAARGAAVHFLKRIDPDDSTGWMSNLKRGQSKNTNVPYKTYLDYYIEKSEGKSE